MYTIIKQIHDALADEESKFIFRQRMLFSLSNDWLDIRNMLVHLYNENKHFPFNLLDVMKHPERLESRPVALFGIGGWSGSAKTLLSYSGITPTIYCDNDMKKIGSIVDGIQIISAEELVEHHPDAMVVISTEMYEQEVAAQLRGMGFPTNQIVRLRFHDRETYFDHEIVPPPRPNGIFVDGGCYDGKSSREFLDWSGGHAKKIYAFEPDDVHFPVCQKFFQDNIRIPCHIEHAGLHSRTTELTFSDDHSAGARFSEQGSFRVKAVALDDVVASEDRVTFIKLDIEGTELDALKGMTQTVRRCHPILAICLYHKPQDIWEIPRFVRDLVPTHRLYIRHYTPSPLDTVLYAIP